MQALSFSRRIRIALGFFLAGAFIVFGYFFTNSYRLPVFGVRNASYVRFANLGQTQCGLANTTTETSTSDIYFSSCGGYN